MFTLLPYYWVFLYNVLTLQFLCLHPIFIPIGGTSWSMMIIPLFRCHIDASLSGRPILRKDFYLSTVIFLLLMLLVVVSKSFSQDLPWFHFSSCSCECGSCLGRQHESIPCTCSSTVKIFSISMSDICLSCLFQHFDIANYMYVLPLHMRIRLNCLIIYAFNLFTCALYIVQVSARYKSVDSNMARQTFPLI